MLRKPFLAAAIAAILASPFASPPARTAESSPVEKLYADLFKLPAAERRARLLEGARKEGEAEVHPSMRGREGRQLIDAFFRENPGIKANFDTGAGQNNSERIIMEDRTGHHTVDSTVGSIADLSAILDRGLFARYPTPANDAILPQYRKFMDPDNRWMVSHWNEHGIVYNSAMIKESEAPKSWEDLCNPRFRGQISMETAETRWLVGLYTMYGGDEKKVVDLLKCLGDNEPIVMKGHTTRLTLMLAGDHALSGDQFFYQGTTMHQKNPKKVPFKAVYEAPIFAYAVGMIVNKSAPNPHAAAIYLDWVLGPTNQRLLGEIQRGPVTIKHPYFPDNATLIHFGEADAAVVERLHGYWNEHIVRKK